MNTWKTKNSKIIYKNERFSVHEDQIVRPDGTNGVFYIIDRVPVVAVVPLTRYNEVYLVHINRYTTKKTHWELPAGSSDKQDELIAAKRELKEETGLISNDWTKVAQLEVAPGMTGQLAHIFVAQNVETTLEDKKEDENIDKMRKFPFKKILQMIESGEIVNGPTISAIFLAGVKLKLI